MTTVEGGISVVVVDDEEGICRMMARELTRRGYQVTPYLDGRSALQHVLEHHPDALVIDQNMPGLSGIEVIEELAARGHRIATVLFTGDDRREVVRDAYEAGVGKVLFKPVLTDVLTQTVDVSVLMSRQAAEEARCLRELNRLAQRLAAKDDLPPASAATDQETILRLESLWIDRDKRQVTREGRSCGLTATEYAILLCLANHLDQVVTHKDLAKAATGRDMSRWEAKELTKQHVRNIRRKIGDDAKHPRFIHTAHGVGYRLAKQ